MTLLVLHGTERERKRERERDKNLPDQQLIINSRLSIREAKVLLCFEASVLNYLDLFLMAVYHELEAVNVKTEVALFVMHSLLKWLT